MNELSATDELTAAPDWNGDWSHLPADRCPACGRCGYTPEWGCDSEKCGWHRDGNAPGEDYGDADMFNPFDF